MGGCSDSDIGSCQSIIGIPKNENDTCRKIQTYDVVSKHLLRNNYHYSFTNIHDPNIIFIGDNIQKYRELNKNYRHNFTVDGIIYKTAEHYYQSQKFYDPVIKNRIIDAETANMAKMIAKRNSHLIIKDFDKYTVMKNSIGEKFKDRTLMVKLKSTGNNRIISHRKNDIYWSDGGDGRGLNMLGIILEQVRDSS